MFWDQRLFQLFQSDFVCPVAGHDVLVPQASDRTTPPVVGKTEGRTQRIKILLNGRTKFPIATMRWLPLVQCEHIGLRENVNLEPLIHMDSKKTIPLIVEETILESI